MIKTKKATAPGDIPAKLIKVAADQLAAPLADVINSGIRLGQWPDIYKMETITPAPKCYPPKELENLRPISNLLNYCKIGEKLISQLIVEDMVEKMDPSQFGNLKNTSIQHYLISLIHRIMSSLDRNAKGDIFANCVTLFDYKQAFSRQCHKLGVMSFVKNGVRKSLIPLLVNYFQGRRCRIKWRGLMPSERLLPGSGAQGGMVGNLEYLSQTNNNSDHIPPEDRWKWVDDLSTLEVINMITVGLSSYNFKQHVASDIPEHGQFLNPSNLKTQFYINQLDSWSNMHKMKLNKLKTKYMIVNFTHKYKFATRLTLQSENIEQVHQAKVLGTILTDDMTWGPNCKAIVKKCNMRLQLLRQVSSFGTDPMVMKLIYIQYIRVILEGSCQVWSGSLTFKNKRDLERIQKISLKIIFPNMTYKRAREVLNIETLEKRRTELTLRFAKNARNHPKLKHFFKLNPKTHDMKTRNPNIYSIEANTERYQKSPILYMKKLLNETR